MNVSRLSVRLYLPWKYTYLRFHGDVPRVDSYSGPWERLSHRLAGLIRPPLLSGGYGERPRDVIRVEATYAQTDDQTIAGAPTPITKDGREFNFMKLGGGGSIRVTYWRTTWWTFWEIVAALVVIAAGVAASKMTRVRRWQYLVTMLIVIILFYSFSVARAWVHLFAWAFIGLVILALVWLVLALVPWARNRRPTARAPKGGE